MRRRLRLPSPAMIVASLALVIALGGTSYATSKISSKDVRNNSLTGSDIRNSSLTGSDVKNSSLTGSDVKNGSLTKSDLKAGTLDGGEAKPNRWVLVNAAGEIERQSGGFSVTAAYPTGLAGPMDPNRANGNVYIDAGEDLSDNGIVATVVLQNAVDQDGNMNMNGRAPGADANAEFSGEIAVSQCGFPTAGCAPPGTANVNHFVTSPRNADGSVTTDGTRKRFYVQITG